MKQKILKFSNYSISLLLSLLGFGGACTMGGCEYGSQVAEYGTPSASFKVYGTVTSEDNAKIPNLKVVMFYDTVYTDSQGSYEVKALDSPDSLSFTVKVEDVDGDTNGKFTAKDTVVVFTDPQFTSGDGWYRGETSKEVNIQLKTKN